MNQSFLNLTTKVSKTPKVLTFRQATPNFGSFPKVSSNRNSIGSGVKRVALGSVSTESVAKFSAKILETFLKIAKLFWIFFVKYLTFKKLQAKLPAMQYVVQKEMCSFLVKNLTMAQKSISF